MMQIFKIFQRSDVAPDPVKNCNVYKTVGCAHVDGMLCDMRTCTITVTATIKPQKISEVESW